METVNNLASSASRAIWGTSNTEVNQNQNPNTTEPIAGETGDVKAGEPYDKGNLDSTETDPTSTTSKIGEDSEPDKAPITAALPIRSEHETDKTGVTSHHDPPSSLLPSDKPTSSNPTTADPSSAPQPFQQNQGAGQPLSEPPTGSDEHERILATKKELDEAAKIDTSGPGPQSLEEKAAKSGGDITETKSGDFVMGGKTDVGDDGPQKESHDEGTGEKYVKSTGVKADGGDFDAANAGAGKEADRLLEQKGVHRTPGVAEPKDSKDEKSGNGNGKEGKEKVSLKDKIKAKLHKN